MNKDKCCSQVPDGMWRMRQCSRDAGVSGYCKQHDPVLRKAKNDAAYEAFKAESAVKERKRRLELAAPRLLLALRQIADGLYAPELCARIAIEPFADYDLTEKDKNE